MVKSYIIILCVISSFVCCHYDSDYNVAKEPSHAVIERYDRLQTTYLTTGDFAALQQMSTKFPAETRILIEDVLRLGSVEDVGINRKLLYYFQDSTLQTVLNEVRLQYSDMDDIERNLDNAFRKLSSILPDIRRPKIYTQIGALNQSIVVDNSKLAINLDKYLGGDFAVYAKYYTETQRRQMTRKMIVPDCLFYFLLSLFPEPPAPHMAHERATAVHYAKLIWIVNKATGSELLRNEYTPYIDSYMKHHREIKIKDFIHDTAI